MITPILHRVTSYHWPNQTMDDFFTRAMLGGIGVALMTGPLGCLVIWRRLAYFGAALSHAALLGVALGYLLEMDPIIGVIAICLLTAFLLSHLEQQALLSGDTVLGIVAHVLLAAGLVSLSFIQHLRVDLMAYLFGDILAVSQTDVVVTFALVGVVVALLSFYWRPLITLTVSADLAAVEGINVQRTRLVYIILLALVIAVGMKIVGVLLVVSLLIIPSAAARLISKSPERMAFIASGIGSICVVGGLMSSLHWDLPAGPTVVLTTAMGLALCWTLLQTAKRFKRP